MNYYRKAVEKTLIIWNTLWTWQKFFRNGLLSRIQSDSFLHSSKGSFRVSCYFSIGCNFLGLQEYEKADYSLEKYLELDEHGYYYDEARSLLEALHSHEFYLDFFNDIDPDRNKSMELATKGKELLDKGEYKLAVRELEKAARKDPSLIFARNNLALAYFCIDDLDRAIEVSLDILADYPFNVHANCNLALSFMKG